jgi:hypothetical protein
MILDCRGYGPVPSPFRRTLLLAEVRGFEPLRLLHPIGLANRPLHHLGTLPKIGGGPEI